MAKSRLEILQEELDQCIEIITHQFIERDIAMYNQDMEVINSISQEISQFMSRRDALEYLIETTKNGLEYDFFIPAEITIT